MYVHTPPQSNVRERKSATALTVRIILLTHTLNFTLQMIRLKKITGTSPTVPTISRALSNLVLADRHGHRVVGSIGRVDMREMGERDGEQLYIIRLH